MARVADLLGPPPDDVSGASVASLLGPPPTKAPPPKSTAALLGPRPTPPPPEHGIVQGAREAAAGVKGAMDRGGQALDAYRKEPVRTPNKDFGAEFMERMFGPVPERQRGEIGAVLGAPMDVVESGVAGAAHGLAGIDPRITKPLVDVATIFGPGAVKLLREEGAASKLASARLATAGEASDAGILAKGAPSEKIGKTLTRHEDALYRLTASGEADKITAKKIIASAKLSPTDEERLYHAIEARMADPKAAIPADLKGAYETLKPRLETQRQLRKDIKAMAPKAVIGDEDQPVDESGYIHRVRADKAGVLGNRTGAAKDPITGGLYKPRGKSLSRQASSLKGRKYFVLEDSKGNRVPAPKRGDVEGVDANKEWVEGASHVGTNGETYTVKPATTLEIEQMDPAAKYVKSPTVNTEWNILNLQRVKRNIEYLHQSAIPDLASRDLAFRERWRYKDSDGRWQTARSNGEAPEGFVPVHEIPELDGIKFHPRIANMLKDFADAGPDQPAWRMLSNVNRALVGSMFFNPIKHDLNIAGMWAPGRGWNWVTPQGWRSLLTNGTRAIKAVHQQNDDYVSALKEGLPLQFSRAANADFYKLMIRKAGIEIEDNPQGWDKIAKTMGFTGASDLVKGYYRWANKSMWATGDTMMLQRYFELMDQGMSAQQARAAAEREIASYRVPTEAFGSRAATNILNNRLALVFSPYHYNVFKTYANMVADAVRGSPKERMDAAGKLFVLGVMAYAAAPIANKALQKLSGNPNARVQGAGLYALPDRLQLLSEGQREAADVFGSYITPTPGADMAFEWTFGRGKDWTGKDIVDPDASPAGKLAEGLEYAGSKVSPIDTAMQAAQPGGLAKEAAAQVGIDLPTARQTGGREKAMARRKKSAARREARDPLAQLIGDVIP